MSLPSQNLPPIAAGREPRKPAPPDAEGDWKFSLRTSIAPSPEINVLREDRQYRARREIFQLLSVSREAGFRVLRGENSEAPRRHAVKSDSLGKGIENMV